MVSLYYSQAGPPGPALNPQVGTPPQMSGGNPVTSQNAQQNLLISQTNTLSMGGGQITQNVNSSTQSSQGMPGMIGQNVSPAGMRPNIRMPGTAQTSLQPTIPPVQRAPFENSLEAERRQNLEKINQLKQTLEAHQQQEQQYKNQLERISHMKTSQLQEALQIAQQTEMHFKLMENVSNKHSIWVPAYFWVFTACQK